MKFLCDVHIARKVVRFFQQNGIEAIHVNDILDGSFSKDWEIAHHADQENYIVISKDADFKNRSYLKIVFDAKKG